MTDEPVETQLRDVEPMVEVEASSSDDLYQYGPSSRVPHIGHAILFLSFTGLVLFLFQLMLVSFVHTFTGVHAGAAAVPEPKLQIAVMAGTYLVALASCFLVFPLFWERGFLAGLNWDGAKALRLSPRLIALGLVVGILVQAISSMIPMPKSMPMDDFFRSPSDVWLVTFFGTLVAPMFEEIAFRGFLLPAFAIAFDWLGPMLHYLLAFSGARFRGEEPPREAAVFVERASAGLAEETGNLYFRSKRAIFAASLLSSTLFAMLHADQLAHAWGALSVLFCVSLLLTMVRVHTKSVACSTIVHASYNLSVFLTLFIATGGYRHLDKMAK